MTSLAKATSTTAESAPTRDNVVPTPTSTVQSPAPGIRQRIDAERSAVETWLRRFLEQRRAAAADLSPRAPRLVDAVGALTLRGGKRVRPLVMAAAHHAVDPQAMPGDGAMLGAALELLQTYLLIHDDWMDQDETRRGGPAVHVAFRQEVDDDHDADGLGVLAGNLAATFAWRAFLAADLPESHRKSAVDAFLALQTEVLYGQQLDVLVYPDVERIHRLKTTSYTVLGPARIGAALGRATPAQHDALSRWAIPVGLAFQLRDDLLGTYPGGNTGKPGDDLRHGKETGLSDAARRHLGGAARERFGRLFGNPNASDADLAVVAEDLEKCGVRAEIESRCDALVADAKKTLEDAPFSELGRAYLSELTIQLTRRAH